MLPLFYAAENIEYGIAQAYCIPLADEYHTVECVGNDKQRQVVDRHIECIGQLPAYITVNVAAEYYVRWQSRKFACIEEIGRAHV